MPPKRSEARAKAAAARQRTAIQAALDRGEGLQFSSSSQVSRIGGQRTTDAQGRLTPAAPIFQELARARGLDDSLDPWVRGTDLRGNKLFAERRSGKNKLLPNNNPMVRLSLLKGREGNTTPLSAKRWVSRFLSFTTCAIQCEVHVAAGPRRQQETL